jgi:putative inorganic carbon (hco3(-)) transporter
MAHARANTAAEFEWRPEAAHVEGTGPLFVGYLLLIVIEYLALQQDLPILKVIRFSTILSYSLAIMVAIRAPKLDLFERPQTRLMLAFIALTMVSIAWAVVKVRAFDSIRPLVDYFCFMLITVYVVDRRSRVKWLCATIAFVASVLVLRNLNQLGDASRSMHFNASYFMGDGNDFSWGMNMMLPIAVFLVISKQPLLFRLVGAGGTVLCLMGIIGTSSRGGSLGLVAAGLFAWLFVAKRRALGMVAIVFGVCLVAFLAPSGYFTRMQTVTPTGIDEDNSAQIRLQAWGAAVAMALDYPLGVGAGNFGSAYGRWYRPVEGEGRIGYGANRWVAAHSIYFKVVGEYGFPGVVMLLWLIGSNISANMTSRRPLRQLPAGAPLDDLWPGLLNMSMIGTAVCGVFLGGFNYPHLFLLSGLAMSTSRIVEYSRVKVTAKAATAAPTARALPPTERPSRSPRGRLPVRPVPAATTGHSYFD